MVDRQPCLLKILDTGKLNSSRGSEPKLTNSWSRPISKSERYVCKGIRRFRPCILVRPLLPSWTKLIDSRITQRETFDEIARLRGTIMRIKQPPNGVSVPMVIVGSKSPSISRRNC
jgi:hypothetical protein